MKYELRKALATGIAALLLLGAACAPLTVLAAETTEKVQATNVSAPLVQILRQDKVGTIHAGEEFTITLKLNNLSGAVLKDPVLTLTPSDSLLLMESTTSKFLRDMDGSEVRLVDIKLKAADTISSASQSLSVDLKYNYDTNDGKQSASSSERVLISAEVTSKDKITPLVHIYRDELKAIGAKEKSELTLWIENKSPVAIEAPVATFTVSEGLLLMENTASSILPDIAPGSKQKITLSLQGAEEIGSASQSIGVDLKYNYTDGSTKNQGTSTEKVLVPTVAKAKESTDIPTPNVIISAYSYGENAIPIGDVFDLSLSFRNTSGNRAVENIVMTLDTGDRLSINSSSNTFYYKNLPAGGSLSETVKLQALPVTVIGSAKIEISFKYEFVDNGKRSTVTSSERITVPVYQPDRFELVFTPPVDAPQAGSETTISLSYVNKGKSPVSNVMAELIGDISALSKTQNLGNFDSGRSGTIDFIVTPETAGTQNLSIKVTYEDANMEVKTREFPVTLEVVEAMPEPDMDMPMEEPKAQGPSKPILIGIGAVVLIGLIIIIRIVKNKKKKAQTKKSTFNWGDENEKP